MGDFIVFVFPLVYNNLRCVCGSHKLQPLVVCIKLFFGTRGLGESKFFLEIIYMEVYRLMAAYAIIENGGKQYKVSAGDVIYVEKMDAAEGDKVVFDKVVFADGKIGAPYVDGVTVSGTVEKQGKEKKVVTFKYKPKKHSHKKQGHRQPYTKVVIDSIA